MLPVVHLVLIQAGFYLWHIAAFYRQVLFICPWRLNYCAQTSGVQGRELGKCGHLQEIFLKTKKSLQIIKLMRMFSSLHSSEMWYTDCFFFWLHCSLPLNKWDFCLQNQSKVTLCTIVSNRTVCPQHNAVVSGSSKWKLSYIMLWTATVQGWERATTRTVRSSLEARDTRLSSLSLELWQHEKKRRLMSDRSFRHLPVYIPQQTKCLSVQSVHSTQLLTLLDITL